jgi:hypothetical protein
MMRGIEMRKAFKASRLIGLLALLAGFMAVSATAAQAETNAFWLVNGVKLASGLNPTINAKSETEGILLTKVGLSKVEILCTEIKFVGATLGLNGGAKGKIHFQSPTGCITKLNGTEASACKPKSPGASLGLIETNALTGLIVLHTLENGTKDELVELKPEEAGKPFATLELGASCAIGTKFDITGTFFIKDCKGEGLVDKVEHLFEEGPLSKLLFGANPMTIDGSSFMFLTGAHAGMTFAGHAG